MAVKRSRVKNKYAPILFVFSLILIVLIVSGLIFLAYIFSKNYIVSDINKYSPDDTIASDADMIIINNVLMGGMKDGRWTSASSMYKTLKDQERLEIVMYDTNGKLGTFETANFKSNNMFYYTKTTKLPEPNSYVAVSKGVTNPAGVSMEAITADKFDVGKVKDALGKYKFLNSSVNIVEAYSVSIDSGELGRLYSVTSKPSKLFGVYSALVYVDGANTHLIKYSYVRNLGLSSAWPVYSVLLVLDLNGDGISEIVLQETTATEIKYSVITKINNIYTEVLSEVIELIK